MPLARAKKKGRMPLLERDPNDLTLAELWDNYVAPHCREHHPTPEGQDVDLHEVRRIEAGLCWTCDAPCFGSNRQAGHGEPSSIGGMALKFHPLNIHRQCLKCNRHLGGWGVRYFYRMEQVYGRAVVDQLLALKKREWKLDKRKLVAYYKNPPEKHPIVPPFVTDITVKTR